MRPHVAAVYAFARVADDIADEGTLSMAARQIQLREWQERLHGALTPDHVPAAADRDGLIVAALAHTIRVHELPVSLFDDLLSAFGQDTMTNRYASWTDVLDYCRRSANPVGRLVLRIAGYREATLDESSDRLCTALQLTNFWQDFGRDWRAGRLYVPREVLTTHGAAESTMTTKAGRLTPEWTRALRTCVEATHQQFAAGRAVCDGVHGRLRLELRLTWLGGRRILERVERIGADLFNIRPTLGVSDAPVLLWRAARWGSALG
jgi:phytoene synthase